MDNLQKSKVLKELGLEEKDHWMLHDENGRKMFEWIDQNLDRSNILTDQELTDYKAIVSAGLYKTGDALDEDLKSLEAEYPGVLETTEDELDKTIEQLERELAFVKEVTTRREVSVAKIKKSRKVQRSKIADIEKKREELVYEEKVLTEMCIVDTQKLSALKKSNLETSEELKKIFLESQNPPLFVHEMQLDQLFHESEQFLSYVDIFMRKHFHIEQTFEAEEEESPLASKIAETKKRINEVKLAKFEAEVDTAGIEGISKNLAAKKLEENITNDIDRMHSVIDNVELENEELSLQLEVAEKETRMLTEQTTEQKIEEIFNKNLREKKQISLEQMDILKSIQSAVEIVLVNCELLSAVMQLDMEKLKNRVDVSDDYATEAQDCDTRMHLMDKIAQRNPQLDFQQSFLKKLQDFLFKYLKVNPNQVPTIDECFEEISRHEQGTAALIKGFLEMENLKPILDAIKLVESNSEDLRKFIFRGPTNRPCLNDSKYQLDVREAQKKIKEQENALSSAKARYRKEVVEPFVNDKYFKMEKNLWIYFLNEPKKVVECIELVQKKAAEVGSSSFKALNITMSKGN